MRPPLPGELPGSLGAARGWFAHSRPAADAGFSLFPPQGVLSRVGVGLGARSWWLETCKVGGLNDHLMVISCTRGDPLLSGNEGHTVTPGRGPGHLGQGQDLGVTFGSIGLPRRTPRGPSGRDRVGLSGPGPLLVSQDFPEQLTWLLLEQRPRLVVCMARGPPTCPRPCPHCVQPIPVMEAGGPCPVLRAPRFSFYLCN